ncbi:hypothetical protein SOCE26_043990 [Sorangium cellulosum]|uniref:Secreted protein n=1 Tax=Sorangium cellulosum TaxID=56 RepID=A0A2L0EUK6_SORCE|nr:hypothetical protein [Sorangium cellulosum]AUX42959.1 hypothetical protein SOCE26_043990 [Sorangium cellulosum]
MKRSSSAVLSLSAAVALLGVGAPADATTAVLLSREELVHRSATIARVTVGPSYTTESDDGRSIVTRTELTVTQPLKGAEADKGGTKVMLLEQIGGTYNGKTQRVLGDAKLSPGEDALVFLRPGDKGRWHFTALSLSVYHVDTKGLARRSLEGLHLVRPSGGALVPIKVPAEEVEPIESLMTDVVRIAGAK